MAENVTEGMDAESTTEYDLGEYAASNRSQLSTAVAFLLIGASAGAIAALLLAPRNGRQMRRALRYRYENAMDTLAEWQEKARERVSEQLEDLGDDLGDYAEDFAGEAVSQGVSLGLAAQQRASELRDALSRQGIRRKSGPESSATEPSGGT